MDFIPKVKMNYDPDEDDETSESNPNFVYEDDVDDLEKEATHEEEEEEIKDNSSIKEDEIFHDMPKKEKPKKKRKPMSEDHKKKLAVAREKALETRRNNAQLKKKEKDIVKETKRLERVKKEKALNKLKKEVESDDEEMIPISKPDPKPPPKKEVSFPNSTITKKDIEEANLNAIMKYDEIRKSRKEIKKKEQQENEKMDVMRKKLHRAMFPNNNFNSYGGF